MQGEDITLPSGAASDLLRRVRDIETATANLLQVCTALQADNARLKRRIYDLEVLGGLEIKPPLPEEDVVLQNVKKATSRSSQKLARILAGTEKEPK